MIRGIYNRNKYMKIDSEFNDETEIFYKQDIKLILISKQLRELYF